MNTDNIVILVTAKDKTEAQKIARGLLAKKLIACANILDGVQSLFWWEGKIDDANETLLVLKSRSEHLKEVTAAVKELHSYQVPEVIALSILGGNQDYLNWIKESVK